MMDEQVLEAKALADFAAVKGKLVRIDWLYGYIDDNGWEGPADGGPYGVIVRVLDTPENELRRWCCEWLDPIYDVEVIVPGDLPEGLRSCWIHGKSYNLKGEEQKGWIRKVL